MQNNPAIMRADALLRHFQKFDLEPQQQLENMSRQVGASAPVAPARISMAISEDKSGEIEFVEFEAMIKSLIGPQRLPR